MATKAGYEHWLGFCATEDGVYTKIPKVREGNSTITADEDDETSWDGGGWEDSYPGIRSGSFSFTMWKDEDHDGSAYWTTLQKYSVLGTRFYVQMLDSAAGDGIQCLVYITSWADGAPERGRATTDVEIKMADLPRKVTAGADAAFA